ncbi:MAG: 4-coumarate--CoA ligase family protein [Deinococcota bacterium]|jgi:acyl-CoA synthetase (AMP-forming)/AMP-acid ligase II|nr:4-coumarate--CoA ligase family protein [Deinococcota bacterium]
MIYRSPFPDVLIPELPLTRLVLGRAAELGDKPALIEGPSGRTLSYRQVAESVKRVAASLAERGFKKGNVFAIYSPNLPEYAIVFHAVAVLGGTVTTVNPLYTSFELSYQLKDAGASFLVTAPAFLENARKSAEETGLKEVFVFGEAEGATPFAALLQSGGEAPEVPIDPKEDVVVLPYSSGTTGLPKGVMLTHYNLAANLRQLEGFQTHRNNPVTERDVLIGLLPFYHIYGMVVVMNFALYQGATVVTMPRFDLKRFLDIVQSYRVSYANLVPPIVLALAKQPLVESYDLSSLHGVISGAAPLGKDVAAACARRLGCEVTQGYGMTELSPVTHNNPDPSETIDMSLVGPCIPNTECRIVDVATGEDLGPGEPGELLVRGPQMMKGYLNNPVATAKTIDEQGWLHTGDIATVDAKGYFAVIDRVKELIKYKGFQIAPAELEAVLLTHPAVSDAAVIGLLDEEAGEVPKAFVVRKEPEGKEVGEDAIMSFVAERVAPYKKLRKLEFVAAIPRSPAGKILRRVLISQEK